jgi:hypothetical protein
VILCEAFGVRLSDEAKGLPIGVRLLGGLVHFVTVFGFGWMGASISGPVGSAVAVALGALTGTCFATLIYRGYRARQAA